MSRQEVNVHYVDALPKLGLVMVFLRNRLTGRSVRELCESAVLTVTGHFRLRPDPAAGAALRAAFADLDRDLAAILGDRRQERWLTDPQTKSTAG